MTKAAFSSIEIPISIARVLLFPFKFESRLASFFYDSAMFENNVVIFGFIVVIIFNAKFAYNKLTLFIYCYRGREKKMTHFLISDENPEGLKLEDILRTLRADIVRRQVKIIDDEHAVAQSVIANNMNILNMLTECISLAESSTQQLDKAFGKSGNTPRIGND